MYSMVAAKQDAEGKKRGGTNWSIIRMVKKLVAKGLMKASGLQAKSSAYNTKKLRQAKAAKRHADEDWQSESSLLKRANVVANPEPTPRSKRRADADDDAEGSKKRANLVANPKPRDDNDRAREFWEGDKPEARRLSADLKS